MHDVSHVHQQVEQGNPAAAEEWLPVVYDELRRLADRLLAREQSEQTLQATALVHEAWLRLVGVDYAQHWSSRRHFFGAAAQAMRRILVDKARRRNRCKHGGDRQRVAIPLEHVPAVGEDRLLEALDEALDRLERVDAVACELVKLRYFGGLSQEAAGRVLDLAPRTADRLWAYAKAWLVREMQRGPADSPRSG